MRVLLSLLVMSFLGVMAISVHAENLNYMSSGHEEWSVDRMQKEISDLEGEIKLSQMRLEEMKKELAERLSKVNTAAGNTQESSRDHFMSHN